jgi:hypothetical protein
MYYLPKNSSSRIMIVSFFVYIFVNLFENLIHYEIGKFSISKDLIPTQRDWTKIIGVMIVFAGIQGLLTCYLSDICF